jgi:hypothetical protein
MMMMMVMMTKTVPSEKFGAFFLGHMDRVIINRNFRSGTKVEAKITEPGHDP